jgi:gliding motility-associated-like protein
MKKYFLVGLSILSTLMSWSQVVDAGDDISQCSGPVTLSATVNGVISSNNYSVAAMPAFTPEVIAGTGVTLGDDAVSGSLPIGFTFCFFNNSYNNFYIGSNGWISFTAGQPTNYVAASIPSSTTGVPKNCIMGPWQDWNPGTGGQGPYIKYQTIGTAPFRKLVVTFDQIPMFSCTSSKGKFQIVINETSNLIQTHIWTKPACNTWPGGSPNFSVLGIHNLAGTVGVAVPGRNNTSWTATNESWEYTPSGTPPIVWTNSTGTQVGTGNEININTIGSDNYIATVTVCGGSTFSDTVHVQLTGVSINQPQTLASIQSTGCGNGTGEISVSLNNGIGPYTYVWEQIPGLNGPIASGLTQGQYNVTIIDQGADCEISGTFNVPQENNLNISATTQSVTCPGLSNGQAFANVIGQVGDVTYAWSGSNQTNQLATNLSAGNYMLTVTDGAGCIDSVPFVINEPNPIIINVLNTDDNPCNGGQAGVIQVQATGGPNNTVFNYSWNTLGGPSFASTPTVNNLAADIYVVTASYINAQGQTCANPDTIQIYEPLPMGLNLNVTNIGCSGAGLGSIEAIIDNPIYPVTYNWNGFPADTDSILNNIPSGNYSLTVTDANGCIETQSAPVVSAGNVINTTADVQNVSCANGNDGEIVLNPTGGAPDYIFDWINNVSNSNTATNLASGTYNVTITDANGCAVSFEFDIVEPQPLSIDIQNIVPVLCNGGSNGQATAVVTGGTLNYNILWSNFETGSFADALSAGNFSVTVTDGNGCTASDNANMTEPQPYIVNVNTTQPSCNGGNDGEGIATVTGGTPDYSYAWSQSNLTGSSVNNLSSGQQSVTVTDANGCSQTQNFNLLQPAAIQANFTVTDDVCGDSLASGALSVAINGGTPGYQYSWLNQTSTSNTQTELNNGTYYVTVTDNNGCIETFNSTVGTIEIPLANFVIDSLPLVNDTVQGYIPLDVNIFDLSQFNSNVEYNWGDGGITEIPAGLPTNHLFDSLGYFNVSMLVTGPGGCTDAKTFVVFVYDFAELASFNVFSPNGDGENDVYRVSCENFNGGFYYDCGEFTVEKFSGKIFNRWGNLVYEWNSVNKGWDGKINGNAAAEGQYLFIGTIKMYDGTSYDFQEWLTLMR